MTQPTKTPRLLGQGIYDVVEVARLTGRDPQTILAWTTDRPGRPALLRPDVPGVYTFVDLISLNVISELRKRGVSRRDILRAKEFLESKLGTDRPFAHRGLATVGSSVFVDLDSWLDAGLGGQAAFEQIIEPLLKPIEFDDSGLAALWRPYRRVWLNPRVQAGAPCIEGRRVLTATIAALIAAGESAEAVADEYDLTIDDVEAAIAWETQLQAA